MWGGNAIRTLLQFEEGNLAGIGGCEPIPNCSKANKEAWGAYSGKVSKKEKSGGLILQGLAGRKTRGEGSIRFGRGNRSKIALLRYRASAKMGRKDQHKKLLSNSRSSSGQLWGTFIEIPQSGYLGAKANGKELSFHIRRSLKTKRDMKL